MKKYFAVLFLFISTAAHSADTLGVKNTSLTHAAFERNTYTATVSGGFINSYSSEYTVPPGFEKGSSNGLLPIFVKVEYAVSNRVSIAFATGFNTIIFNSFQLYTGYNGPIKRFRTNKFSLFSGGLIGYYHFGHILKVKRLDPFVGAGINLNKLKYSAFPEGDSTIEKTTHNGTPYLKAGARYYISDKVSVFADAGYDKLAMVSVGISCRFFPSKNMATK